jgi:hypothetical protein
MGIPALSPKTKQFSGGEGEKLCKPNPKAFLSHESP